MSKSPFQACTATDTNSPLCDYGLVFKNIFLMHIGRPNPQELCVLGPRFACLGHFFYSHKPLREHSCDLLRSAQPTVQEAPDLWRQNQTVPLWGFIHPTPNTCECARGFEGRAVVFFWVCPGRLLINIGNYSPGLSQQTVCTYGHHASNLRDLKVKAYRKAQHQLSGAWKLRVTSNLCSLWWERAGIPGRYNTSTPERS